MGWEGPDCCPRCLQVSVSRLIQDLAVIALYHQARETDPCVRGHRSQSSVLGTAGPEQLVIGPGSLIAFQASWQLNGEPGQIPIRGPQDTTGVLNVEGWVHRVAASGT